MPIDDPLIPAVDRALADTHGQLGQRLRALAAEITRIVLEDVQGRDATAAAPEGGTAAIGPTASAVPDDDAVVRVAAAIRALDEADTLGAILDTLAMHAARAADRSGLLLVRGDRFQGWRFTGFDGLTSPAKSITLEVDMDSLLGGAIRTGADSSGIARPIEGDAALPPFARGAGARHAAAFPILVGGVAIGVLYADAPIEAPAPQRWRAALAVLARHAGRVLEALTLQRALGLAPFDASSPPPAAGEAGEQME